MNPQGAGARPADGRVIATATEPILDEAVRVEADRVGVSVGDAKTTAELGRWQVTVFASLTGAIFARRLSRIVVSGTLPGYTSSRWVSLRAADLAW